MGKVHILPFAYVALVGDAAHRCCELKGWYTVDI